MVFFFYFFTYRQEVFLPSLQTKYHIILIDQIYTKQNLRFNKKIIIILWPYNSIMGFY